MSSRDRRFRGYALTAFLLVWGAAPALASERLTDKPASKPATEKPALDMTLASNVVFVPTATVSADAFETQSPKPLVTMPPSVKTGTSGDTVLRRSLIVSFGALQALDAHSTLKALKNGGVEANPVMSGIASNGGALLAVKMGTAAATAYFAERLAKNHPKRAVVLMAVLNSAYVAVVAHNYRVARGQR